MTADTPLPSFPTPHDAHRGSQLDRVGGAFLRARPVLVGMGGIATAGLLVSSSAPRSQVMALGLTQLVIVATFAWEALRTRRHPVTERWLNVSLTLTVFAISLACGLSGGLASPASAMLLAPVGISFAAFGRRKASYAQVGALILALPTAQLIHSITGFARPPEDASRMLTVGTTLLATALLFVGVTGLAAGYEERAEVAERMRKAALDESAARRRDLEAMGDRLAHEIKNPLASIKGLVQLVARDLGHERAAERMQVVQDEILRLEHLLVDYFAFSKPLTDLALEDVALDAWLSELVVGMRARTGSIPIEFEAVAGTLRADGKLLAEACRNLLGNAVDACGADGSIDIATTPARGGLSIKIVDNGNGMTQATLSRIGEAFFTTRDRGVGLGVRLAKTIIEQHGGTLTYASTVGQGTTATIWLPHFQPGVQR